MTESSSDIARRTLLTLASPAVGVAVGLSAAKPAEQNAEPVRRGQGDASSIIDLASFGALRSGQALDDALDAALALGPPLIRINGEYEKSRTTYLPTNTRIECGPKTILGATRDNLTFFKNPERQASYGTRISDMRLDGNGKRGVTGFDFENFRVGAAIVRPSIVNMDHGIVFRKLCWSTMIEQPYMNACRNPIRLANGSNSVDIIHPEIQDFDVGVIATMGPDYPTIGPKIRGGYIQDGRVGFQDQALQSVLDGVYFETCTEADIFADGASFFKYDSTNHSAAVGSVGIRGRKCQGGLILNPYMGSAQRSLGLLDFDESNVGVRAEVVRGLPAGQNAPLGNVEGVRLL